LSHIQVGCYDGPIFETSPRTTTASPRVTGSETIQRSVKLRNKASRPSHTPAPKPTNKSAIVIGYRKERKVAWSPDASDNSRLIGSGDCAVFTIPATSETASYREAVLIAPLRQRGGGRGSALRASTTTFRGSTYRRGNSVQTTAATSSAVFLRLDADYQSERCTLSGLVRACAWEHREWTLVRSSRLTCTAPVSRADGSRDQLSAPSACGPNAIAAGIVGEIIRVDPNPAPLGARSDQTSSGVVSSPTL
jgi:hypothetical protein